MNKNALKVISTIMSDCADVSYKVSGLIFLFMFFGRNGIKFFIRTAESYLYYDSQKLEKLKAGWNSMVHILAKITTHLWVFALVTFIIFLFCSDTLEFNELKKSEQSDSRDCEEYYTDLHKEKTTK